MDVKIKPYFPEHHKLAYLAELLNVSHVVAAGHLIFLLCAVMKDQKRRITGVLEGWNEKYISRVAQWESDPLVFVESLVGCGGGKRAGFLEKIGDEYAVYNWKKHQGDFLKKNEYNRLRNEEIRGLLRENRAPQADSSHPLVDLFGFCKIPGYRAKQSAIQDLLRQGVKEEKIQAYASDPMKRNWDFYTFIKALRPIQDGIPDNGRHSSVKELEAWAKKDPKNAKP